MPIAEQETDHHSFVPLHLPKVRIEIEVMWGCMICLKETLNSHDEAGLGIVMAVFVIVGVKGGTDIKKLIKKYAVMFNSLLSVICFLPGVDSHYYDYSDIDAVQFYDVDQRPSTTKTIERRFRRDDSAIEDVGIIIGAFVGIITPFLAGIICYYCKDRLGRHYPARHMNISSSSTHL